MLNLIKIFLILIIYTIISCGNNNYDLKEDNSFINGGTNGNNSSQYKLNYISSIFDKDNETLSVKLNISSNIDILVNYDLYILKNQTHQPLKDNYSYNEFNSFIYEKNDIITKDLRIPSGINKEDYLLEYKFNLDNESGKYNFYIKDSYASKYIYIHEYIIDFDNNGAFNDIEVKYHKKFKTNYEGTWSYSNEKYPDKLVISRDIDINLINKNSNKFYIRSNNTIIINNYLELPVNLYISQDNKLYFEVEYINVSQFYPIVDNSGMCTNSKDRIKHAYINYQICTERYNNLCSNNTLKYEIHNELNSFNNLINDLLEKEFGVNTCSER